MKMHYLFFVLIGMIAASSHASAQYLDPGSGSFLFQLLIAGLAVVIFYFSKIKKFVIGLFRKKKDKDSTP
jgi:hypothetical protein